jgi:hypothetical protein
MYGAKWLDQWAGIPMPTVKAEWARALEHVTKAEMEEALQALRQQGGPFPPTLPELIGVCRQFRKVGYRQRLTDKQRHLPPGGFQALKDVLKRATPTGSANATDEAQDVG